MQRGQIVKKQLFPITDTAQPNAASEDNRAAQTAALPAYVRVWKGGVGGGRGGTLPGTHPWSKAFHLSILLPARPLQPAPLPFPAAPAASSVPSLGGGSGTVGLD